ncbi:carboxyltransferase domain-containing protein [Microbacterium betulae]|uniref:Carboxyltransferase domain-containing protein n=1 Tax=Microbacterium betulae TaxID=2981139 RepID=A0AA97I6A5_9MICO|nr:carboxyltransferase domain-containing protein [Microbacterium sp. AB]WOF23639.1 carboxyltransferase domain-containing protein [Microbacterium sp. AB]
MSIATILPTGESALRVTGTTGDREADWRVVHALARRVTSDGVDGVLSAIPTYESVLVEFDATTTGYAAMTAVLQALLAEIDPAAPLPGPSRRFVVPVLYGGDGGPDLGHVAAVTGLTPEGVVAAHTAPTYVVRCLGAPGGSPMLDGPSLPVPVPRLRSPRTHVPQGAVSLAGRQATITPAAAPGGWCLIGRTPYTVLDLAAEPLVPYAPGDTLRFERIDEARFEELAGRRLAPEDATR